MLATYSCTCNRSQNQAKKENEINVSAFEEVKTKKHFEKTELMGLDNSLNQIKLGFHPIFS